ncbi:MAG: hypothetical protein JWM41_1054 [Gemmatimonadetes bacterium]|nr:hypothetical protein [Gemmatimonadota bacterium]
MRTPITRRNLLIRADPGAGAISAGVPLTLAFNVSRVASAACTPLTGA